MNAGRRVFIFDLIDFNHHPDWFELTSHTLWYQNEFQPLVRLHKVALVSNHHKILHNTHEILMIKTAWVVKGYTCSCKHFRVLPPPFKLVVMTFSWL